MKNNQQSKSERIAFICFMIAAVCYYINAAISIAEKNDSVVTNICLGSAFLCISLSYIGKYKNNKDKED